ncbi:hypothetical protein AGMMS49949_08200 [Alphaproteobacteria bacterium]|nr:hypothetical protein AGMMS49949_08200 [Alphaproteobacteria bacterium]GHS99076.1 hypothetical protein AGMMS50296_7070 [Alphaproteobacteria bacterium]
MGDFANDMREGEGIQTDKNGKVTRRGLWKSDKPLEEEIEAAK